MVTTCGKRTLMVTLIMIGLASLITSQPLVAQDKPLGRPLRVDPAPIASDKSIKYDYDIVYVRAPRTAKSKDGKERLAMVWPDASEPFNMHASTDLMLLHPDAKDELLVAGAPGAIADPYVSFDAQWVYYTHFRDLTGRGGADVHKVNVKTRKVVRLTQQQWTRNTGVPQPAKSTDGVYNMHPCPLPGGKVAFVSNRDGLIAPRRGGALAMQLFVMDDDGANVEKIGHLNVGSALHPVILKDGRIIFSSLESQGLRDRSRWGIWGIHPDGTNWNPVVSAYENHSGGIFHFQAQLSDESIVVGDYYILAMGGFGTYLKFPARPPADTPAFAPASYQEKGFGMYMGRRVVHLPFKPYGMEVLTHFIQSHDSASLADEKNPKSHHVGRFTQPCGAPDNHLLTVWTGATSPANGSSSRPIGYPNEPPMDAGIYLIKEGRPIWEPGAMLLVKNDPNYNEQWPRPLVPYERIYSVKEPNRLPSLRNDGTLSKHLPAGTPFGLVGTSSLYKRESYPNGAVAAGSVTATGGLYAVFPSSASVTNWTLQGADNGLYSNSDIHAIRIIAMEAPSAGTSGKIVNPAGERFRILGEFPVRHFDTDGKQPLDPDGNPDTSFLAKIPADVAWTFQTLDKHGMVLNMAQTWHQIRPGEVRHDCGGCHAHSQKPTDFKLTAAARSDYVPFDLATKTPLLTTKKNDQSGKKWDTDDATGVRYVKGVVNVEYHRDIKPILERSCVACHTATAEKPAGGLVLDDHKVREVRPASYATLLRAKDRNSEPYVWPFRARNSLLTWKLFGHRVDGFPEKAPAAGDQSYHGYQVRGGVPWAGFKGSAMPPPEAVKAGKVAPLTDEDRRTIFRWIDLGCPLDLDFVPSSPGPTGEGSGVRGRGNGWMLDDQRPTLTLAAPQPGANKALTKILIGMHDYDTGLDMSTFRVTANIPLDGIAAGENLAPRFRPKSDGVWELTLTTPLARLVNGELTVSVRDRQGNASRIVRSFSVEQK
jgi:hypothetical protein